MLCHSSLSGVNVSLLPGSSYEHSRDVGELISLELRWHIWITFGKWLWMFEDEHEDHLRNHCFCNSITNMFVEVDAPCLSQPGNSWKSLQFKFYSLAFPNNTPEDWLLRVCPVFPPQVYWRLEGIVLCHGFLECASFHESDVLLDLCRTWGRLVVCRGKWKGHSAKAYQRKSDDPVHRIQFAMYLFNRPANFVRSVHVGPLIEESSSCGAASRSFLFDGRVCIWYIYIIYNVCSGRSCS